MEPSACTGHRQLLGGNAEAPPPHAAGVESNRAACASMVNEAGTLSEEDNHTVMLILDLSDSVDIPDESSEDNEDYQDDEYYEDDETYDWEETGEDIEEVYPEPYTFIVMRSTPVDKQILFMGIPSNMLVGSDNKRAEDVYVSSGAAGISQSIEYTLGIEIDRYAVYHNIIQQYRIHLS